MLFTSYGFAAFLAVLFLLYYAVPGRFRWYVLLVAGFVFYAFSGWTNLIFIVFTILTTFTASRRMERLDADKDAYLKANAALSKESVRDYKAAVKVKRRRWLVACLALNVAVLSTVKVAAATGFLLPMGISFYMFQTMGYIIDVYRGKPAERCLLRLALFTSFFPQLVQGPISRYDDLKETLYGGHAFDARGFMEGARRLLWGLFKKLVVADRLLPAVLALTSGVHNAPGGRYDGLYALCAIIFYAVTLYADFTGGIDMAIGVSAMLGIRVKENFNMPFYAKSVAEYWRRWHITMGTWFRDYLFYPISISKYMLRFMKWVRRVFGDGAGRRAPVYASTIILWFMTGLWHGATWNFIAWGLANGLVIIVSQELTPLYKRFHKRYNWKSTRLYGAFEITRTFLLMCFIRAFDIYDGVWNTLKTLASVFVPGARGFAGLTGLGLDAADYAVVCAGVAVMILAGVVSRKWGRARLYGPVLDVAVCAALILCVAVFGAYGMGYDANQFIYNRF